MAFDNILYFIKSKINKMANQSAKKNTQKIKTPTTILTYAVYAITAWFAAWNGYYLLS